MNGSCESWVFNCQCGQATDRYQFVGAVLLEYHWSCILQ